jgi:hypothetical protein
MNFKSFGLVLIAGVVATGVVSCSRETAEKEPFVENGAVVRITNPRYSEMHETVELNANTVFMKKEIVRATFAGFVDQIRKNVGENVRTGDLLLKLRTKESAAGDSLPQEAKLFSGLVDIMCRTNGILTTLNYQAGDFVGEGEEIAVISNPSSLRLVLNVPYTYSSRIRPGKSCEIVLPDGKIVQARIENILPSVDMVAQTQTVLLRLNSFLPLPENLNMTARLSLQSITKALSLPASAIQCDETQKVFWMMKLTNDSTAVRVDIEKGIENDSLVQVLSPIFSLADRIVSDGAYGLTDTAKVTIAR